MKKRAEHTLEFLLDFDGRIHRYEGGWSSASSAASSNSGASQRAMTNLPNASLPLLRLPPLSYGLLDCQQTLARQPSCASLGFQPNIGSAMLWKVELLLNLMGVPRHHQV